MNLLLLHSLLLVYLLLVYLLLLLQLLLFVLSEACMRSPKYLRECSSPPSVHS